MEAKYTLLDNLSDSILQQPYVEMEQEKEDVLSFQNIKTGYIIAIQKNSQVMIDFVYDS